MRLCTGLSGGVSYNPSKKRERPLLSFSQMPQLDTNYPRWHFFDCCRSIAESFWRVMTGGVARWLEFLCIFCRIPWKLSLIFHRNTKKNAQQFHPFSRCGGLNSIKTLPVASVLLLSPSRGVERVKKEQSLLPVAIVPRHNVIVLTQFCGTFWQKLCFGFFFSEHFFPELDSTRLSAGL